MYTMQPPLYARVFVLTICFTVALTTYTVQLYQSLYSSSLNNVSLKSIEPYEIIPDFRWRKIPNEELQSILSDAEYESLPVSKTDLGTCNQSAISPMCCLGAISTGGGNLRHHGVCLNKVTQSKVFGNSQNYGVDYHRVFEVRQTGANATNETDMRSAATATDFVNNIKNNSRVMFLGDSTMNQMYDAFLCSFLRMQGNTATQRQMYKRKKRTYLYGASHRIEVNVTSASSLKTVKLIHHREYRFAKSGITIKEACYNIDTLIVNFGIHWNYVDDYISWMTHLSDLLVLHCSHADIIWSGSTPQHFLSKGGLYTKNNSEVSERVNELFGETASTQYDAIIIPRKFFSSGCAAIEPGENFNWRNDVLQETFAETGVEIVPASWGVSSNSIHERNSEKRQMFFIPNGLALRSRFDLHSIECTHYCVYPQTFASFFEGLYQGAVFYNSQDSPIVKNKSPVSPKMIAPDNLRRDDPNFQIENLNTSNIYKGNI